jgi:CDP-diacylglycerol--serine O-phosphatidyltransferase
LGEAARAARMKMFGVKDLFTTGNVLAAVAVMALAQMGELRLAALALFAGYVFDALDGFVARLLKSGNRFGAEYDNAADLVTYSVAPAFVIDAAYAPIDETLAAVLAACPIVSGALRFARFNVQRIELPGFWVGLPRPASAVLLVSFCASRLFELSYAPQVGAALIPFVCGMNLWLVPFHGHHHRAASPVVVGAIVAWLASTVALGAVGYVWEALLFWSAAYSFTQALFIPRAERERFRAFVEAWRRGAAAPRGELPSRPGGAP